MFKRWMSVTKREQAVALKREREALAKHVNAQNHHGTRARNVHSVNDSSLGVIVPTKMIHCPECGRSLQVADFSNDGILLEVPWHTLCNTNDLCLGTGQWEVA